MTFVHSQRNLLDSSTIELLLPECFLLLPSFIWMWWSVLHNLRYMCTFLLTQNINNYARFLLKHWRSMGGFTVVCLLHVIKNSVRKSLIVISLYPGCHSGKESICQCVRHGFDPWIGKIPWKRKWQHTPVFLPGESHGQRSYSPWGLKESHTTEQTQFSQNYFQSYYYHDFLPWNFLSRQSWPPASSCFFSSCSSPLSF